MISTRGAAFVAFLGSWLFATGHARATVPEPARALETLRAAPSAFIPFGGFGTETFYSEVKIKSAVIEQLQGAIVAMGQPPAVFVEHVRRPARYLIRLSGRQYDDGIGAGLESAVEPIQSLGAELALADELVERAAAGAYGLPEVSARTAGPGWILAWTGRAVPLAVRSEERGLAESRGRVVALRVAIDPASGEILGVDIDREEEAVSEGLILSASKRTVAIDVGMTDVEGARLPTIHVISVSSARSQTRIATTYRRDGRRWLPVERVIEGTDPGGGAGRVDCRMDYQVARFGEVLPEDAFIRFYRKETTPAWTIAGAP